MIKIYKNNIKKLLIISILTFALLTCTIIKYLIIIKIYIAIYI